jgi:hypothetical protein
MLSSLTALVFFLYGGLGFPSLPPLPLEKPPALLRQAAPGLPPEQIGKGLVELTRHLEWASSPGAARDLLPMASLSDPKLNAQINLLIKKYAKRHGIDEKLIRAVLQKESGGNPIAVSPKGAMGLMQLMPETAQSLGVDDPFDPEQNLAGGTKYLKYCLNLFCQDVALALAAYNAGPETVKRYGGVPPYAETQHYVAGILGCPVEDIIKKNNPLAADKGQNHKAAASQDPKSAVNLPKPNWKVVHADVAVPTIKWKMPPSLTALNPIPLKSNTAPEAATFSKESSRLPGDTKEAASTGPLAAPKFLNNYGYR